MYFFIPKGTLIHEILRLPFYNYKAQTVRRNDMLIEKHSFGSHRRQHLLFYAPKNKSITQDSVIIYFHGGGWTFGSPKMFQCNAQFFVDQGYTVAMPSYRRLPFFQASDMQEDAILALKKTLAILDKKGLNHKKIIIAGLSSGGHIAGLLAYDRKQYSTIDFSQNKLAGFMFFAAPLDLSKMAKTPAIWRLAGPRDHTYFNTHNPVNYVEKNDPIPVLVIHGTKDGLVNYKNAVSFAKKRGSNQLTFYTIKNGTHLDSANWVFFENGVREIICNWLSRNTKHN